MLELPGSYDGPMSLTGPGDGTILVRNAGVVRGGKWLLREVDWQVLPNATVAVLGANGCGKTTLLRVLCGYTFPSEGQVTVAGYQFGRAPLNDMRQHVRLVAAANYGGAGEWANSYDASPEMPVEDVVASGFDGTLVFYRDASAGERNRARSALADAGVERLLGRLYGTLSTGERTRVQLARALVGDPKVLLLDEPTLGLDIPGRESLLRTLEALHGRTTLVLVTHHPEDLPPTVSDVLLLKSGRVHANGPAADVLTDTTLSAAYDLPLHVHHDNGRYWVRVNSR